MTRGSISHNYDYIPACSLHPHYQGHQLVLTMRQQPVQARVSTTNERDRKPIEPPPIIQIKLNHTASPQEIQDFLQNPYFFMYVNLVNPVSKELISQPEHQILSGQTVSSMYKLKDITDEDGGFFCFGDLSSRIQGEYQLKFSLFEIVTDGIINLMHTFSNVFKVYNSKTMPGLIDATFLSRSFCDQGVRIRIRKEHRVQVGNSKKRKFSAEEQDDHHPQSPPPYERDNRRFSLTTHMPTYQESPTYSTCAYHHHPYDLRSRQPSTKMDVFPLSPRPSISSDAEGWARYPPTTIQSPPSPIRLPPLHTIIPNDDKGDVGHVNAAVAMMQLSQRRPDYHLCDMGPWRRHSTDALDRN